MSSDVEGCLRNIESHISGYDSFTVEVTHSGGRQTLNAIEPLWKALKREIFPEIIPMMASA
ncbi:hypothetical protein [Haladaptatus sp. R4]|uniref:hypothetical protein n=1 Tax=Haladaptatus sp. R4 TaxID=1679489 RepID=UPI0012370B05|nr:hypothetical protein [Haladaptatus sp. R4]